MVGSVFLAHQKLYNEKPKRWRILKMRRWKKELEGFNKRQRQIKMR